MRNFLLQMYRKKIVLIRWQFFLQFLDLKNKSVYVTFCMNIYVVFFYYVLPKRFFTDRNLLYMIPMQSYGI